MRFVTLCILLLAMVGQANADPWLDRFTAAEGQYKLGHWQIAHNEFQKLLDDFPTAARDSDVRFFLGETLVQMRQFDEAADFFADFLDRDPAEPLRRKIEFRAAESNYFARRWDAARQRLEAFVSTPRDDMLSAYALSYLGAVDLEQQKPAEAEAHYRAALPICGDNPLRGEIELGVARACQSQAVSRPELRTEAVELLTKLSAPSSPLAERALPHLVACLSDSGDFASAERTLAQFESRFPKSARLPQTQLVYAKALYRAGKLDTAYDRLKKPLHNEATSVEAQYWLGLVEMARSHPQKAADLFGSALAGRSDAATNPLAAALSYHQGEALWQLEKCKEAEACFTRVVESWPKDEWADDAELGRIRCALRLGRTEAVSERVKEFDTHWLASELQVAAHQALVRSLLVSRDYGAAEQAAQQLLEEIDLSKSAESHYLLALALFGLHRYDEANVELESPLVSDSLSLVADAKRTQASAWIAEKKFSKACAGLRDYLAFADSSTSVSREDRNVAKAQLCLCYARTDRLELAKTDWKTLREATEDDSSLMSAVAPLAEAALDAGDPAWAGELFALLYEGKNPDALRARGLSGLAWSHARVDRKDEALKAFERVATEFPDTEIAVEANMVSAELLEQQGKLDAALEHYRRVASRKPTCDQRPSAIEAQARLHEKLGEHAEAIRCYQTLKEEYPTFPRRDAVLYNLAWAQRALNDHDAADATLREVQQNHRTSSYWSDAVYRLAERAANQRRFADANSALDDLLKGQVSPQVLPHALYLQAQVAMLESRWNDAVPSLQRIIDEFPENALRPSAEFWLGEAAYRNEDFDAARKHFNALTESTEPSNERWRPMLALRRAQLLAQDKEFADARELAESITTKWPDFAQQYEADYLIGRCLIADADFDGARAAYRRAIGSPQAAKSETSAIAQWMIGESYMHQRQYREALREYLQVDSLHAFPKWQAAALLQAGKCYEALDQWSQAVALYARLVKDFSDTPYAEEAQRRLHTAQQHLKTR